MRQEAMKKFIRRWLGIQQLQESLEQVSFSVGYALVRESLLRERVDTFLWANARIIAKIDPNYDTPETDPERRKQSDELGAKIIEKLKAEAAAAKHTTGEVI